MGTLVIEEWREIGTIGDKGPIYKGLVRRTADTTTSTTPESLVTKGETAYVSIRGVELHRVSIGGSELADSGNYIDIVAGDPRIDIALHKGGDTIHYRLDA